MEPKPGGLSFLLKKPKKRYSDQPMPFTPDTIRPSNESDEALWFVYHQNRLLIQTGTNGCLVPRLRDLEEFQSSLIRKQYLGFLDEIPCYAAELSDDSEVSGLFALKDLRALFFGQLEEELDRRSGKSAGRLEPQPPILRKMRPANRRRAGRTRQGLPPVPSGQLSTGFTGCNRCGYQKQSNPSGQQYSF